MRIGFLTVCAPGHLFSTTALARKLKSRGHDVVFINVLDAEPFVQAAGLSFVPYAEKEYPRGSVAEIIGQMSKLQGQEALVFTMNALAALTQATLERLPERLLSAGIDALVLDETLWFAGLVPMHLGMPYAHFSVAVTFDSSGNAPLCTYPWEYEDSAESRARNLEGVRQFELVMQACSSIAHDYADKMGLNIDWTDPFATISKLTWFTQTPKEFDFPSTHWPKHYHYTGPFHDGQGRVPADFPWDRLTGEPLIYASMGTLQNGIEPVFSTIAEAVGERPGMQLVMSVGPTLDAAKIRHLPANAIVVKYAPQQELLKRSALCITHAGLNTTLESLTQGVPMVAIPVTNDQPGVAARIAYTKTGEVVPLQELTVDKLKSLIDTVLGNPEYSENARRMKQAINGTSGLEKAADLLEEAFGLPRKASQQKDALAVG